MTTQIFGKIHLITRQWTDGAILLEKKTLSSHALDMYDSQVAILALAAYIHSLAMKSDKVSPDTERRLFVFVNCCRNISEGHAFISVPWKYKLSITIPRLHHCKAIETCTAVTLEWGWVMLICIITRFVLFAPSVILSDVVTHSAGSV